jgi:DNA polymerase-4
MDWSTHRHQSYPRAFLHIDANAFFASCEKATHPEYKNKPVVTGVERGIASSFCYIAKAYGVTRGMVLSEVKKRCPNVVLLPSDYELYGMFSERMFAIVRKYTNLVEAYSIDECFAEITGMRRTLHKSYPQIAACIKQDIQEALGITVSVGLAPTKCLAKLAANWVKPDGLTFLPIRDIRAYAAKWPVEKLWGVGKQTAQYMKSIGIRTTADFIMQRESFIEQHFTKPHIDMWKELTGNVVYEIHTEKKQTYKSISKGKTFTPPSQVRSFVYSQLIKNLENACIKARRHHHVAQRVIVMLKTQEFRYQAIELHLSRASAYPHDIIPFVQKGFQQIFSEGTWYRSTQVVLAGLQLNTHIQANLFEPAVQLKKIQQVYAAVDMMSKKFGKHTVHLGASLPAQQTQHKNIRGTLPKRRTVEKLQGETDRQRLGIPMIQLGKI